MLTINFYGNCQKIGDYLFAVTSGNLNIRSAPNENSDIIGIIASGQKIKVAAVDKMDTIQMRIAHWVGISNDGLIGFVFSGYLNREPKPNLTEIDRFHSISEIMNYLSEKYSPDLIYKYSRLTNEDMAQYDLSVYSNSKMSIYNKNGYEWGETEYVLNGWHINELINLIELCRWLNENPEYELLKSSNRSSDLSFHYITGFSDPARDITIEQGKNGVRVLSKSR